MTTKTKPTPVETPRSLALPDLPVDRLSKDNRSRLSSYQADVVLLATEIESLNADRRKLLGDGPSMTVEGLKAAGAKLAERKQTLEQRLRALHWERYELAQSILPDIVRYVEWAEADRARVFEEIKRDFAAAGVTELAFPAGEVNPPAAEKQLEERIKHELPALAAIEGKRRAESLLRTIQVAAQNVPTETTCVVAWPAAENQEVAALAGV